MLTLYGWSVILHYNALQCWHCMARVLHCITLLTVDCWHCPVPPYYNNLMVIWGAERCQWRHNQPSLLYWTRLRRWQKELLFNPSDSFLNWVLMTHLAPGYHSRLRRTRSRAARVPFLLHGATSICWRDEEKGQRQQEKCCDSSCSRVTPPLHARALVPLGQTTRLTWCQLSV